MTSFDDPSKDQPRDASGQFAAASTSPTTADVLDGANSQVYADRHVFQATGCIDAPGQEDRAFESRDRFMAARKFDTAEDLNATMGVMAARDEWDTAVDRELEQENVSPEGAEQLRFNKAQTTIAGLVAAQRQNRADRIASEPDTRGKTIQDSVFFYGVGHPASQGEGSRERYLSARSEIGQTPAQGIDDWNGEVDFAVTRGGGGGGDK